MQNAIDAVCKLLTLTAAVIPKHKVIGCVAKRAGSIWDCWINVQRINLLLTRAFLPIAPDTVLGSTPTTPLSPLSTVRLPRTHLHHILPGALSTHMSYPLIHMSCSNVKHRLNNFDFSIIIMLGRKLVLSIYYPASAPVCKCGTTTTHDIYGHHHFRCIRISISKKAAHNCINEYAGLLTSSPTSPSHSSQPQLLESSVISASSFVQTEAPHHITNRPLLRPFDIEYQPNHTLGDSNLPPSQSAVCGADTTIDHCPDPPSTPALEDISLYTANAERCLQAAERRKFTTMGGTITANTMTREDVLRTSTRTPNTSKCGQYVSLWRHGSNTPQIPFR